MFVGYRLIELPALHLVIHTHTQVIMVPGYILVWWIDTTRFRTVY